MKILKFEDNKSIDWDDFLKACPMASFMHTRRFLSYHKDRFQDESILIMDEEDGWLGILPAATNPNDNAEVVSHPGITFGGILHKGKLIGSSMLESFEEVCKYYADKGYKRLIYKATPYIYHQKPSSDDLYALFRQNAELYRRDLSCTIDLNFPLNLSNKSISTMNRRFRKAEKNNVTVSSSENQLSQLWEILTQNLQERYQTKPVHSYEEMLDLLSRFPENIKIVTAIQNQQVIAGIVLFINFPVYHTQYLVVTPQGAEVFALDYLMNYCIELAREKGARYFDFGINNEQNGQLLNQNLYMSKAKHGGGGVAYDFYKINL